MISQLISDYQSKLINHILFATSQQEVKDLIDATLKEMELQGKDVVQPFYFAEKTISKLELFSPLKKDAQ